MKGYEEKLGSGNRRPAPKVRSAIKLNAERKRKTDDEIDSRPIKRQALASDSDSEETFGKEAFPSFQEELQSVIHVESQDKETQTEMTSTNLTKRDLFLDQVTCPKHCYWYTGLTREKLDLIYHFVVEKAKSLKYWKGSVDTPQPTSKKRGVARELTTWQEFVLTLVRNRRGFDVKFLADTFEITTGQISRIYNTWIKFLASELSFLVPWPTQQEIRESIPKRFKKYPNVRIIIDCVELYIQKPKLPSSQKITWSNYKHWNTAKLLIGITPTGVISFVPPLWTGLISDKEIVKNTGLIDLLDEGDAIMADRGFLIRDLCSFKKIHLICPAYCRGARLSARGTTYSRLFSRLLTSHCHATSNQKSV